MSVHRLGPLDEIAENDALGYAVTEGDAKRKLVVARWTGEVYAYLNRCPHAGTPLDWVPDKFLDRSRSYLICQTHGALFEVEDGECIDGPCLGDRLEPVTVRIVDGEIEVEL